MRIGIDISQIVFETGVSNYTKELVRNLLKIDKKNHYVLFGSSLRKRGQLTKFVKEFSENKKVQGKILWFPPSLLSLIFSLPFLKIEKFTGELDIFHSSDWIQPPTGPNTKNVTTVHDMISYVFPSSLHPKIVSNQKRRMKRVKKHTDKILADSKTTKDDLVKFLEIEPERIEVIYLAAGGQFKPQDDDKVNEVLTKYKIKKPYILSVSTQEPRKNIQKILDVFSELKKRRNDINLVLVGKQGWGAGFRTEGETEGIVWTGFVPEEDLIALYCGSRIFIYPSLYEGFGLPILEAMACGAPVITSNNSSMKEIGKDAAILVDPRSEIQLTRAIELLLDLNLENYQKMVRASLERSREYSWVKTARETLKVYEDLVQNSKVEDEGEEMAEEKSVTATDDDRA